MAKATEDALDALHGLLAASFVSALTREGGASASEMNVIRQFLKDNGIEATDTAGSRMGAITDALPFPTQAVANG
jgi:hypothetical protein